MDNTLAELKKEDDLAKTIELVVDDDEDMEEQQDEVIEEVIKTRVDLWLEQHGAKLFALEYSKAAVKENKRAVRVGVQLSTDKPTREEGVSQISSGDRTKRRRA